MRNSPVKPNCFSDNKVFNKTRQILILSRPRPRNKALYLLVSFLAFYLLVDFLPSKPISSWSTVTNLIRLLGYKYWFNKSISSTTWHLFNKSRTWHSGLNSHSHSNRNSNSLLSSGFQLLSSLVTLNTWTTTPTSFKSGDSTLTAAASSIGLVTSGNGGASYRT